MVAIRALGEDFRMAQNEQEREKLSFQCESSTTAQIAELARRGDRSISAEIRRALREHVANQDPGVLFPPQGLDSPASATDPVKAGAVEPPQHAGPEEVA